MAIMSITPIPASYQTPISTVVGRAIECGLKGKCGNEVIRGLDAIQVWRDWFEERYGELSEIRHRSNPDDPPDLDLVFESGQIGAEVTSLKPFPLGYAEAVAEEINPNGGRLLPSITGAFDRERLEKLALNLDHEWADVGDEHRRAVECLVETVTRKMKEPASRVICVIDETTFGFTDTEWLATHFHRLLDGKLFGALGDRVVILLNRLNDLQYFSALFQRGAPLLAKRDGVLVCPLDIFQFQRS